MSEVNLDACGCCEGPSVVTPAPHNPPGLRALEYRVGTHGRFNAALKQGLATTPALRALTTRDSSDPSIALLDAWAVLLDVLTFYQERIANEGFLRTATERRSVLELARAIGYELRPGVAAGTCLAFTVDSQPGSPASVRLEVGTRAQSVPGQDERAQTFETVEEIEARPEWNALKPQTFVPSLPLKTGDSKIHLLGVDTGLNPGDGLLLIGLERAENPENENWDFRRVVEAVPFRRDPTVGRDRAYTCVTLDRDLGSARRHVHPALKAPEVHALRRRAAIFGYNAVNWRALPDATKAAHLGIADPAKLSETDKAEWPCYTTFSPEAETGGPRFVEKVVHVPATAQQVATAVTTAAYTKATGAAAAAVQAGLSLVSTGAALGQSAADLADRSARALEDVAKQSASAVRNTVAQALETQMRGVSALIHSTNNQAAVDAVLRSATDSLASLHESLMRRVTELNPIDVVRTVLNAVGEKLDEQRNVLIEGIAKTTLDEAKRAVGNIDPGSLLAGLGGAVATAISSGNLTPIVDATLTESIRRIEGIRDTVASRIPGYIDGAHGIVIAGADVFKPFKDALDSLTPPPGNTVEALFALAKTPITVGNSAAEAAGNVIRSAASFAYGSLALTHANLTAISEEVSRAAIAAAKVVNPDNVVADLRDAADALRLRAEDAALAGQKSVGAAISASIVSAAVKIALEAPPPLPPPTPESIAAVAELFGDATIALLQAGEGVTPLLVTEAVNSQVGQFLGDAFAVAREAIAGARTFVSISDAPVNGARETVTEMKRSADRALLGTSARKQVAEARKPLPDTIDLDAVYPKIVAGKGWLVLSTPEYREVFPIKAAVESARAEFGLSGKTTRITLGPGENHDRFNNSLRSVVVYAESEQLTFADKPRTDPVSGGEILISPAAPGLKAGQLLSVAGLRVGSEQPGMEIVEIGGVQSTKEGTRVTLVTNLAFAYKRETVTINANVARATHGETKKDEVLGSGDGSLGFQRFTLKRKPLTYVSAPLPGGAASTLEVRVKGVRWHEVPSFYRVEPGDRAYVVRRADDGSLTVQFGDGSTGARLPTGTNNVTATYRAGLGLDGLVKAETITTLMSRPLGLKAAMNPIPATGAGDPEKLADARTNAPLTVLTLDRIVSVRDFEDFARAFAGIGKAQASLLWNGERQIVHLTVAGAEGQTVEPASASFRNLLAGIDAARHADQLVRVSPHTALLFTISARVATDPDRVREEVIAAVKAALRGSFAFEARAFGQGVTASEVLTVMQNVHGVVAVDLESLDGRNPIRHPNIPARAAYWDSTAIKGAELLLIDPDGITLTDLPL